jgi:hypothetical protein
MDTDVVIPIVLAVIVAVGTLAVFLVMARRFPVDE